MTEQTILLLFSFLKTTSFVIGITLFVRGITPPLDLLLDKKSDRKNLFHFITLII